jgi:hypothetical protein
MSYKIEKLNINCPDKHGAAVITFNVHEHSSGSPSYVDKKTITRWSCDKKGGKCNNGCEESEKFLNFKNKIEQI